jgi:hypothetical protein
MLDPCIALVGAAAGTGDVFVDEGDVGATLDGLGAAGCTVVSASTGVPPPQGYHNPEELAAAMAALASRFSDLAEVIDLTRTLGVEPTAGSRSIFALKISDNVAVDEAEQNLLVVAEHHARELAGPETALHVATMLLEEYSKSDTIRTLVDDHQIYIVWYVSILASYTCPHSPPPVHSSYMHPDSNHL